MSLNRVTIIGHLGQDPELRYLANGQAVGRFSVATDEPYTDTEGRRQERTEWHQIVVFGKVAETCDFDIPVWPTSIFIFGPPPGFRCLSSLSVLFPLERF